MTTKGQSWHMANEAARAELGKAIKRVERRIEQQQKFLGELAEQVAISKKGINSLSQERTELITTQEELGGPIEKPKPGKPKESKEESK